MNSFAERFTEQGVQQGRQEGRQEGEALLLIWQMEYKFGSLTDAQRRRIEAADIDTLREWAARILTATRREDVLR